ncbi:hypothetical protein VNO80_25364 [Phaseolus coccineus]|uniref:Uncharacterized protein n=1 Tax=Phaseolus coccineus TaxID=3886 RepID=A0AAN9LZD6_PHACN
METVSTLQETNERYQLEQEQIRLEAKAEQERLMAKVRVEHDRLIVEARAEQGGFGRRELCFQAKAICKGGHDGGTEEARLT